MIRKRLLITRVLPDSVLDYAAERFEILLWPHDEPIGNALELWARECDAILIMATDRLDRSRLQELGKHVEAVATYSVGYDHIDICAASDLGLPVFHTPNVLSDAVAETAMLLVLSAARGASQAEATLREGHWGPWSPTTFLGRQLTGRALGIFGMGRIGRAIATRAQAFGLKIHYHNRTRQEFDGGMTYHPSLDSLLAVSEILCVCAPLSDSTRGVLNAARLALLPKGAVFVNVSRGDLVDEAALVAALQRGDIAAAGLDVYQNEPGIDKRLLALPNATLLPHIGSSTYEARKAMGELAIGALESWLYDGRVASNCVNPDALHSANIEGGYS